MKFLIFLMKSAPFRGSAMARCLDITVSSYVFVFFIPALARAIRSSKFPSPMTPLPNTSKSMYILIASSCAFVILCYITVMPDDSQRPGLEFHNSKVKKKMFRLTWYMNFMNTSIVMWYDFLFFICLSHSLTLFL